MSKLSSVPYDVSKHLATFMNQSQLKYRLIPLCDYVTKRDKTTGG